MTNPARAPERAREWQPIQRYYVQWGVAGSARDLVPAERGDMVKWADVAPVIAQRDELLAAAKLYKKVLRPWLDKAIGREGTVTYAEWEAAVDRLEAAITKAEGAALAPVDGQP